MPSSALVDNLILKPCKMSVKSPFSNVFVLQFSQTFNSIWKDPSDYQPNSEYPTMTFNHVRLMQKMAFYSLWFGIFKYIFQHPSTPLKN